jgi:hypothetical protein
LANAAKAYFDHHFGLHDSLAIATNLSFRQTMAMAGQISPSCKRGNVDHGGPYSLLRCYGQGNEAETVADHNWTICLCATIAVPACYFSQLFQAARMLIVEETSREASIRGSPN